MPIDPSPEGGEVMHKPVTQPFPTSTPDPHDKKPTQDEGPGLTRGPVAEPAVSRPPLGN